MRIRVAGLSHRASRPENDDYYGIGRCVEQGAMVSLTFDCSADFFHNYGLLATVADGMGGYAGGAYASRTALEILHSLFFSEKHAGWTRAHLADRMRQYLSETQVRLSWALSEKEGHQEAGTTLAGVVLMPPDALVVFHAGDSRVLRASSRFVRSLTVDHTLVGADLASGRITEQALLDPGQLGLTRSLGVSLESEVEIGSEESWALGDRFMICSDGWHGVGRGLSREQIRESLSYQGDIGELVESLVNQSALVDGEDNATLVVVDIDDGGRAHG